VEVRQAAGQSIADLNRNCSADGIYRLSDLVRGYLRCRRLHWRQVMVL